MDCLWQVNRNKFMKKDWIYNPRRQKRTTFKDVVKKFMIQQNKLQNLQH